MTYFDKIYIGFIIGILIWSAIWFYLHVIKESPTAKATRILLDANTAYESGNIKSLEFLRGVIGEPVNEEQKTTLGFIELYIYTLKKKADGLKK